MCYHFYFVWIWRQFRSISPRGLYWHGRFNTGFFTFPFWGAYIWRPSSLQPRFQEESTYVQSLCYGYHLSFILKLEPTVIKKMALELLWKRHWGELRNGLKNTVHIYTCGLESARSTNGRWLNFMAIKGNSKSCWRSLNFV